MALPALDGSESRHFLDQPSAGGSASTMLTGVLSEFNLYTKARG